MDFDRYMYIPIKEPGKTSYSCFVFALSFNLYGTEQHMNKVINEVSKVDHFWVTVYVLNQIKQLSEWRMEKMKSKLKYL